MLISPGYAERALDRASNWEDSTWPFLTEVLGVRGGQALAQRFLPGTVTTPAGQAFQVGRGNAAVESQFSLVNPDGAAVVFNTVLAAVKASGQPAPVATAFSYGKGRAIYVGFTFENLADVDLQPAFQQIMSATGLLFAHGPSSASRPLPASPSLGTRSEGREVPQPAPPLPRLRFQRRPPSPWFRSCQLESLRSCQLQPFQQHLSLRSLPLLIT